jgi:hypothetical protein
MRQDFHPLCNEDYSEMAEVTVSYPVPGTASEAVITDQRCTRQGCTRHYDPIIGYYDSTAQGRLQGKHDSPYTCNEHQVKLFVKSYNWQSDTEVWQCPTDGCTRTETVRVAA